MRQVVLHALLLLLIEEVFEWEGLEASRAQQLGELVQIYGRDIQNAKVYSEEFLLKSDPSPREYSIMSMIAKKHLSQVSLWHPVILVSDLRSDLRLVNHFFCQIR